MFDGLNPFRSGQCLSTLKKHAEKAMRMKSQSLSFRAMSFDTAFGKVFSYVESQSLSFRAMSFDIIMFGLGQAVRVSIPFVQGNVFRRIGDLRH